MQWLSVQNTKKKRRKCDTKGFVPVASLNVVVRFPSSIIIALIGRTENILSVIYMNEPLIYASKTLACNIRECAIVHNVLYVTLTGLLIF